MNGALWLLPLFAVGYALWAFFRLWRMERNEPADGIVAEDTPCRQEIIGRGGPFLPLRPLLRGYPLCPRPAPLPATSCRRI